MKQKNVILFHNLLKSCREWLEALVCVHLLDESVL